MISSDKSIRIYIACVIYNKKIEEVTSYNEFLNLTKKYDVKLLLLDNSTNDEITLYNNNYKTEDSVIYIDNGGNIGLSKAYNTAIRYAKKEANDCEGYLLLADDDTEFSDEYLNNACKTIVEDSSIKLVSGIIRAGGKIISPIKRNDICFWSTKPNSKLGNVENVYVFNSGWLIALSIYDIVGMYDENIFLDMLDYWFMDKLHENRKDCIRIVNGDIFQNFSGHDTQNITGIKKRFEIYKKDFETYCKGTNKSWMYKNFFILRRIIMIKIYSAINKIQTMKVRE